MNTFKSHTRSLVAVSLLCLVFGSACVKYARVATISMLGTHRVSVRPACDGASTHSQSQTQPDGSSVVLFYELRCGDTTVKLRGNMLSVNDRQYGTLNEYDQIAVDYGKVRVNSEVRAEVR